MSFRVNPNYRGIVYSGFIATGLAACAVFTRFEALRIIGFTILTGAGYGVASNLLGCRECIEFYTDGHRFDGKDLKYRLVETLDPNLNAIACGVASWQVFAAAGSVLAFIARAPVAGLKCQVAAAQLLPYLAVGALVAVALAHFNSLRAKKNMEELEKDPVLNPYLPNNEFDGVPPAFQSGWEACYVRNKTGSVVLALGGIVLAGAIFAARIGSGQVASQ